MTSSKNGRNVIRTKWHHQNFAQRYLLRRRNVASHGVKYTIFVEFIAKTEEFVVFMYVYNKNIITFVTWSDGSDHVEWLRQELLDQTRLRLVWSVHSWRSHSTWSDPSDQVTKVIMCIYWMILFIVYFQEKMETNSPIERFDRF